MTAFRKVKKGNQVSELSEEVIDKICNFLRVGVSVDTAIAIAGVPKSTYYYWMKVANGKAKENHTDEYTELCEALLYRVEVAVEEATMRDALIIDTAAQGKKTVYERDENGRVVLDARGNPIILEHGFKPDWSAAAWKLERRRPKDWSRTEKQEVNINNHNIEVEFVEPGDKGENDEEED